MTRTIDDITALAKGKHSTAEDGLCLLEATAWLAGEPHTDHPACASLVAGGIGRRLNDIADDETRQLLLPYAPLLIGTRGDGLDKLRANRWITWSRGTRLPRLLDALDQPVHATTLRDMPPVDGVESMRAGRAVIIGIRDQLRTEARNVANAKHAYAYADAYADAYALAAVRLYEREREAGRDYSRARIRALMRARLAPVREVNLREAIEVFGSNVRPVVS